LITKVVGLTPCGADLKNKVLAALIKDGELLLVIVAS